MKIEQTGSVLLGEWAFELFKKIIREKTVVLYSETTFKELRDYFSIDEIERIFSIVADKGLFGESRGKPTAKDGSQ